MSNHKLQAIPYLMFNGDCAEALDFYAKVFDGEVVNKKTCADTNIGEQS